MNQQLKVQQYHSSEKEEEGKKRGGGEGLGCGGQGLSKGEVWAVGRAYAQDPQGWKRPWGLWGVGLRLNGTEGARRAPQPWSQRVGDITCEPSRLPGFEWVGKTPSSPPLLLPEGPSHLPLLLSSASEAPILSGLHFSSLLSPPTSYWFTWGFLPSPWASGFLTSGQQMP